MLLRSLNRELKSRAPRLHLALRQPAQHRGQQASVRGRWDQQASVRGRWDLLQEFLPPSVDINGLLPPANCGTPLRTPWNSERGSPKVNPFFEILYSRIVSSCIPVRFLITETARRTLPKASKYRSRITLSAKCNVDRRLHVSNQSVLCDSQIGVGSLAVEVL